YLARGGAKQRAGLGLLALLLAQKLGDVLVEQARLQVVHRQHVAVAHDQIDVVECNTLGLQAIVDDLLMKARVVLIPGDALFGDGVGDLAIAKQARADVMVIGVDAEDICALLGHACPANTPCHSNPDLWVLVSFRGLRSDDSSDVSAALGPSALSRVVATAP